MGETGAVPDATTMTVILAGDTLTVPYNPALGTILDAICATGAAPPYMCKVGICAMCCAKLIEGDVDMAANHCLPDHAVADGYILTCQAVPTGNPITLDYDYR